MFFPAAAVGLGDADGVGLGDGSGVADGVGVAVDDRAATVPGPTCR